MAAKGEALQGDHKHASIEVFFFFFFIPFLNELLFIVSSGRRERFDVLKVVFHGRTGGV
jgi:hypothetical protein